MKKSILLSCISVFLLCFALQYRNYSETHVSDTSMNDLAYENMSISLMISGPGPHGQVDGNVSGGSAPYKWFKNGSLVATTFSSSITLQYPCNGGTLTVEDVNGNRDTQIVTQCN